MPLGMEGSGIWYYMDHLDNAISSWRCGAKVRYVLCDDRTTDESTCTNGKGESGAGQWDNRQVGRNDKCSELTL